ncbi:hypothetical protein [Streptomyces sp. B15]|uniref:hypothetical protein n=1 Tax=Streptomyces sp. B15 TaxID=1537797 RepID=UPI001B36BA64|nr:hypothetical protein [Streptomyces sp. B15]MBQ1122653.1 hypothetical protein [Streptomyces sp. B15]
MATFGYADLPVPGGSDAPTGPAALAELAQRIDRHLVQHVADQAERDATLDDAPLHTVATAQDGSLWIKTDGFSNTWATIWEPLPDWRPIEPASGYQGGAYTPQVRRVGNQVWLRGRLQRVDEAVIPTNGVKIGQVPDDCIPQEQVGSIAANSSLADDVVIGVGKLEVLDANTASSLGDPGAITWWSQDGSGTSWVNISGSYWID